MSIKSLSYNEYYTNNTNSKFIDGSIPVNTKSNNGRFEDHTNSCFWISVCDGLANYGFKINPIILKRIAGFENKNNMIDTLIDEHIECIQKIVDVFDLEIHIHISMNINNIIHTQPVPINTYKSINPKYKIRILQKLEHFELITTHEGFFDLQEIERIKEKHILKQLNIEERIKQQTEDRDFALMLQLQEDPNFAF